MRGQSHAASKQNEVPLLSIFFFQLTIPRVSDARNKRPLSPEKFSLSLQNAGRKKQDPVHQMHGNFPVLCGHQWTAGTSASGWQKFGLQQNISWCHRFNCPALSIQAIGLYCTLPRPVSYLTTSYSHLRRNSSASLKKAMQFRIYWEWIHANLMNSSDRSGNHDCLDKAGTHRNVWKVTEMNDDEECQPLA